MPRVSLPFTRLFGRLVVGDIDPSASGPGRTAALLSRISAFELALRGQVRDNEAGGVLPSSLPELTDRFLGTRTLHTIRPARAIPLRDTLEALAVPLDPSRREFVNFPNIAIYSSAALFASDCRDRDRADVGPGAARFALRGSAGKRCGGTRRHRAAIRILPVGKLALLVLGLLPMTLFQFASASPDAALISTAFLFTAIAIRSKISWSLAQVRSCWLSSPGSFSARSSRFTLRYWSRGYPVRFGQDWQPM